MKYIILILFCANVFGTQVTTKGIADQAVTNAKIANSTINLTTKVIGVLPSANGGTGSSTFSPTSTIGITIDGGGQPITTGIKGYIYVPFNCTITAWTALADQTGSVVVDVWKDTYANYPPTLADTIAGSELPTISSAVKGQDTSLTTWTTSVSAGDVIGFNVNSASTVTWVQISLTVTK